MACGPVSGATWYIVYKDTIAEEVDEQEYEEDQN
jgi:hypothetical protein